ncbi:MAG: thiol-disulfide isomerase/thioredoxin [Planctomycetota bacterium]|jgi:thiol-disulfide isomerase/thioredoxin
MKNKILFISVVIIAIAISIFSYKKYRVPPTIQFEHLTLTDLEGNATSLQNYAGKNIFITMWAPWCIDCLKEMPALQYVKDQLRDENFVFLAISGYDIQKEKAFADKMPYDFDYLHMSQKLKDINIHTIPTNYIISEKGKVVYEKVGAEADWLSEKTINSMRHLVK